MKGEPVELFAEARSSVLRLALDEVRPEYYPSFQLSADVVDEGFTGGGMYWIEIDVWKAFLTDLQECERTRTGLATLEGMSPGEFRLVLTSTDSLGHFDVCYTIKRVHYTNRLNETTLSGMFPLDVSCFRQFYSGFQRLDEAVNSNSR